MLGEAFAEALAAIEPATDRFKPGRPNPQRRLREAVSRQPLSALQSPDRPRVTADAPWWLLTEDSHPRVRQFRLGFLTNSIQFPYCQSHWREHDNEEAPIETHRVILGHGSASG